MEGTEKCDEEEDSSSDSSSSSLSYYTSSDSESDGTKNVESTNKVEKNGRLCVKCEQSFSQPGWGADFNFGVCRVAREHVCKECLGRIRDFWEPFFEKRMTLPELKRRKFDDNFFRTECVENDALDLANFLYLYEKASKCTIEHGDLKGYDFFSIFDGRSLVDMNWTINYVQSHIAWKGSSSTSLLLDIALFFVFPHVYQCWPQSSNFIGCVRAFLQEDYEEIWVARPSKKERHMYAKPMFFLSNFFVQHKFELRTSLMAMAEASHAQNSQWGSTKFPYFIFENEVIPKNMKLGKVTVIKCKYRY